MFSSFYYYSRCPERKGTFWLAWSSTGELSPQQQHADTNSTLRRSQKERTPKFNTSLFTNTRPSFHKEKEAMCIFLKCCLRSLRSRDRLAIYADHNVCTARNEIAHPVLWLMPFDHQCRKMEIQFSDSPNSSIKLTNTARCMDVVTWSCFPKGKMMSERQFSNIWKFPQPANSQPDHKRPVTTAPCNISCT